MTDTWIVQDRERLLKHRDRLVFLDPTGQCRFLLQVAEGEPYTIMKTDPDIQQEW